MVPAEDAAMAFRFRLSEAWTYLLGAAILLAWMRYEPIVGVFATELAVFYAGFRVLPRRRLAVVALLVLGLALIPAEFKPTPSRLPGMWDLACFVCSGVRIVANDLTCTPLRIASSYMRESNVPFWYLASGAAGERLVIGSVATMAVLATAASAIESRWTGWKPSPPAPQEDPLA